MPEGNAGARLDRIERKLDQLEETLTRLDRSFVELRTEQRVRDQERANERSDLLALIPVVRDLQQHIDRMYERLKSVEDTGSHSSFPSLPPTILTDGPTQPGSTMLPSFPDELPDTGEVYKPEQTDPGAGKFEASGRDQPPTHRIGVWDVAMRGVGVFEGLTKGFVTYQRMWGFIVLGIFGPPGLAVGLAQAWMITHPEDVAEPIPFVQPIPIPTSPAAGESAKEDESNRFDLPGPNASDAM